MPLSVNRCADQIQALAFGLDNLIPVDAQYPLVDGDERPVASNVVTDALFACATRNATLNYARSTGAPVFVYRFDHDMSFASSVWGANFSYCDPKVRALTTLTHAVAHAVRGWR